MAGWGYALPSTTTTEKLFYDIGSRYEKIIMAERHMREGNEKIYDDPGFYKGLKRAGYDYLGMEVPQRFQSMIDAYYNKDHDYFGLPKTADFKPEILYGELKADPDTFKDKEYTHVEAAQFIDICVRHARDNNMKIVIFDDQKNSGDVYKQYI